MRLLSIAVVAVSLLVPAAAGAQTTQPAGGWRPLFNGKDLSGWYTYLQGEGKDHDPARVFQIEDGAIHVYKDAADGSKVPMGYVCTAADFADYRVRFQYKWGQKRFGSRATKPRDGGLLYHVYGDDGARGNVWPYSIECQVQEHDVGDIYSVGTAVTTTIDPAKSDAPTYKPAAAGGVAYTSPQGPKVNSRIIRDPMAETDGWNTVEVVVRGDAATHIVNGKVNNHLTAARGPDPAKPDAAWHPLTKGRILLQAEGAEVFYRNIEIKPLDLDPKNDDKPDRP